MKTITKIIQFAFAVFAFACFDTVSALTSSVSSSRIQVMCINYQPFVGLSPKPLFDVHAETLSCSR
jgi:hypothetical protein